MNRRSEKTFEEGDVFAIPLKPSGYPFGLVCTGKDFAFFNFRSDSASPPKELQNLPLAFRVPVAKDAPKTGGWTVIDSVGLQGDYAQPGRYLHKPVGSAQCYIYSNGKEAAASLEECDRLEVLSTWFSFHVQERLEDYFAGRENRYVLAIKRQLEL